MRLGVIINHLDFNLYDKDNEDGPYEVNVDRKGNTQLFQGLCAMEVAFKRLPFTLNAGLHGMLLGLNKPLLDRAARGCEMGGRTALNCEFSVPGCTAKTESIFDLFCPGKSVRR